MTLPQYSLMKAASGSHPTLSTLVTLLSEEPQRGVEKASLEPKCGNCQKAIKTEVGCVGWFAVICAGFPGLGKETLMDKIC